MVKRFQFRPVILFTYATGTHVGSFGRHRPVVAHSTETAMVKRFQFRPVMNRTYEKEQLNK
jgi:hypothetical protein